MCWGSGPAEVLCSWSTVKYCTSILQSTKTQKDLDLISCVSKLRSDSWAAWPCPAPVVWWGLPCPEYLQEHSSAGRQRCGCPHLHFFPNSKFYTSLPPPKNKKHLSSELQTVSTFVPRTQCGIISNMRVLNITLQWSKGVQITWTQLTLQEKKIFLWLKKAGWGHIYE